MTYSTRICQGFLLKTIHFCVLIHCSADCCLSLKQFALGICPSPQKTWFENNRKLATKEICITIDSPLGTEIPERKPDSEAGCIFENFTPKQGDSLKILAAGTRNHGVSLPPPRVVGSRVRIRLVYFFGTLHFERDPKRFKSREVSLPCVRIKGRKGRKCKCLRRLA